MTLNTVGGRKFLISLVSIVATATLMWFGKIDDGVYSTVIIAAMGAYIAGNVTQKAKEAATQTK